MDVSALRGLGTMCAVDRLAVVAGAGVLLAQVDHFAPETGAHGELVIG